MGWLGLVGGEGSLVWYGMVWYGMKMNLESNLI